MNICVHSMGNVRSNNISNSIDSAGMKVFETHTLRHNVEYFLRLQHTKPDVKHLQDSLKVKTLIKQKEEVLFIVVLGDPIKRNLLTFLQGSKKLSPEFEQKNTGSTALRAAISDNEVVTSPQAWMDHEIQDFLGVDFEKLTDFEGDTLIGHSAYGPVLFVKSELTAAKKSVAVSKYLGRKITVKTAAEAHPPRVKKLYSKVRKQGLADAHVNETLDQLFVQRFYTKKELGKIRAAWKDKLFLNSEPITDISFTGDYSWVSVHHMGNVGADYILGELDKQLDQTVFETRILEDGVERLENINKKHPNVRHAADGLDVLRYLDEDAPGKFIVVIANPIIRNFVTYILNNRKALQDLALEDTKEIGQAFEGKIPAKSAQVWFSKEVLGFFNVDYKSFAQIEPGVAYFNSEKGEVLIVGSDVSDQRMSAMFSKYLGQPIKIDRADKVYSVNLFHPKLEAFFSHIKSRSLSPEYVKAALGQRFISEVYSSAQIMAMRLDWENSVATRRFNKDIPIEEFGKELPSWKDTIDSDERIYEAEGGFHHYGARTNIAAASYWAIEPSHPKDLRNHQNIEELRTKNFKCWKDNRFDEIEEFKFSPNIDVAFHDISVEVDGIPIENYPFLLGDGCVYYGGADIDGRNDRHVPGPSEAHCTALSLRTSSSFLRSLELPEDLPIFLSKYETLDTPQHFARHKPHSIRKEDLDLARVRTRIKYRKYKKGMTVHKFLRIPYLDQYPFAPVMVPENKPWYHAWDKTEPLKVKGFTVYFSPKSPIRQQLERIKVLVLDKDGNPVKGKELSMEDQNAGGSVESFSLKPSFVRGDLIVEPGEYLSASAYLVDGTPAADTGFYILVEIPESKVKTAFGSPLFYSQGCANLEYLQELYDADRREFISTPAAFALLRNLSQTPLKPWSDELGLETFPKKKSTAEKIYTKASKYIFVN